MPRGQRQKRSKRGRPPSVLREHRRPVTGSPSYRRGRPEDSDSDSDDAPSTPVVHHIYEQRRGLKSKLIRVNVDTADKLDKIKNNETCRSLEEVILKLLERYEIHQALNPRGQQPSPIPCAVSSPPEDLEELARPLQESPLHPSLTPPVAASTPAQGSSVQREKGQGNIVMLSQSEGSVLAETPKLERWKKVVPPVSPSPLAWNVQFPDKSDYLDETIAYGDIVSSNSDSNSYESDESEYTSDDEGGFSDDFLSTSYIPTAPDTSDTDAEGYEDFMKHIGFDLNVKDDEVQDFCYGEEIDHELNFKEVAEKTEDEMGGETTEEEIDEIVRVDKEEDVLGDSTTLAYASCLKKLAKLQVPDKCKVGNCVSDIQLEIKQVGTAMYLKWTCQDKKHINKRWCSQPRFKFGQHAGDFALCCGILFTGNNYSKVATLFGSVKLKPPSQSTYTRIHGHYAVPAVEAHWENINAAVLENLDTDNMVLLGDGRMDSPGFNAQFCTYSVMENSTKDIVNVVIVDKREVEGKSTNMERFGFIKTIEQLKAKGVTIAEVVTDAHGQIMATVRKTYPEIKHSLDVWHGAKNLGKKIIAASAERECGILLPWTSHITNHFWHVVKRTNTYDEFMAMWRGILHHVSGVHEWLNTDGYGTGECRHNELERNLEDDNRQVIPPGSKAHSKLRSIVFDTNLLKKVEMFLNFRTTSELESFNNKILGYASKRHAFQYPGYRARCLVAAIDYQENKNQEPLKTKSGEFRMTRIYRKRTNRWDVVYEKEKTYHYVGEMMAISLADRLLNPAKYRQKIPLSAYDPRRIATHSGKVPPPPTKEIYEAKMSRFEKE